MSLDVSLLADLELLIRGEHFDPHRFLGVHALGEGKKVIRLWRPGAKEIYFELFGAVEPAQLIHEAGIFEALVPENTTFSHYRIYHQNGQLGFDPYAFLPTWGEIDSHLFSQGVHYQIYEVMGGRLCSHEGVKGVKFAVWAPSALRVSLVGDFNFWDGRVNPMRSMGNSGVWELFVPGLDKGERYKFEIKTREGELKIKSDPYAYYHEVRPFTASIVDSIDNFSWHDESWIEKRAQESSFDKPLNIYEMHLGSWRLSHGRLLNYKEIALQLVDYLKKMHFTHVELLPILEHPLDESWGYQVTGFYSVTSRFGTVADFQFFVDYLHRHGFGVILDWVPGHFPTDDFSLARFDGTSLYEHLDPRQGYHPHWSTNIFNFGRKEVTNFLLGSALFWLEKMHIDGLRVDAVASMLYLDYGREEGHWIPNQWGGRDNLEAIEFIKHLNAVVHEKIPGVITIAEESTAFPGVTTSVQHNGLGFDYKWNMGWMNDTLRYFQKDPIYRSHHHHDLTFGLLYAFSERFILVLSHDEVVHGKGHLISKMPGDLWQKYANLRLLLSYMICQPGKKMLFMGAELGQWDEWRCKEEIPWYLLQYPSHKGIQEMVSAINKIYLEHPPLWEKDTSFEGFEWVQINDTGNSVLAYRRKGSCDYELLCVHTFTPNSLYPYFLPLPHTKKVREIFNSDDERYGGSNKLNPVVEIIREARHATGINITLAPLATQIFQVWY